MRSCRSTEEKEESNGREAISGAVLLRCWSATFSPSTKHWRFRKSNTRGQHREKVLGLCKFALSERTCISMCVRAPARSRVDACVTKARLHVGGTTGQIAASARSTYRTNRGGCAIDCGSGLVRLLEAVAREANASVCCEQCDCFDMAQTKSLRCSVTHSFVNASSLKPTSVGKRWRAQQEGAAAWQALAGAARRCSAAG